MISSMGFILYAIVLFVTYKVETIRGMIEQALILAPELSAGMFILYFYPLALSSFLWITKKKSAAHGSLLRKQTNVSASVAVSLGLIGTFLGLTAMVAAIAASMGGDGDMADRMGAMLSAISDALGAMSYAFLTSILGVGVSVLLIVSLNFWNFGFESEEESSGQPAQSSIEEAKLNQILEGFELLLELNQASSEKIARLASSEEKTERLIEGLRDLNKNNHFLYNDFLKAREEQSQFNAAFLIEYQSFEIEKAESQREIHHQSVDELKSIKNEIEKTANLQLELNDQSIHELKTIKEEVEKTRNLQLELIKNNHAFAKARSTERQAFNRASLDELNEIKNALNASQKAFAAYAHYSHKTTNDLQTKIEKIKQKLKGLFK